MNRSIFLVISALLLSSCAQESARSHESAEDFVARANEEYRRELEALRTAQWVRSTYLTPDTAKISTEASARFAKWHSDIVAQSKSYRTQDLAPELQRALTQLKLKSYEPAPNDPAKREEMGKALADMSGRYSLWKYCRNESECRSLGELTDLFDRGGSYEELLDAWVGWRKVSPPMRKQYERFVELGNEGARELGYADLSELWRAGYDMSTADFDKELEKLWRQVEPLYKELHCHVRAKLGEIYGTDKVPQDKPIPAHLLGNMWAQNWTFLYPQLEPFPGISDLNVDATLKSKNYTAEQMVKSAEEFYLSLGLPELPSSFWERSQFSEPSDRDVVCHAHAWSLDGDKDLRISMCIKQTYDNLRVIYHELGHIYYMDAYRHLPPLFWDGAHDGFHEAIGDVITLSMTPDYLAEVGLASAASQREETLINRQMLQALRTVAFLPFGKLVDDWRLDTFSGEVSAADYNKAWWELRTKYQGIAAPVARSEEDFDPGAKFHIPANVPYSRYFLAHILQFQFQRALCDAAGYEGPLHSCSIYKSKAAGERLHAMLATGASQPWQDSMELLTGTRQMQADALIEYFAPLMGWLREQNHSRQCGW